MYGEPLMASSERDWQAEDDMRTLMRAKAIERDPKRLAKARAAAKRKLTEQNAETTEMKALANGKG